MKHKTSPFVLDGRVGADGDLQIKPVELRTDAAVVYVFELSWAGQKSEIEEWGQALRKPC